MDLHGRRQSVYPWAATLQRFAQIVEVVCRLTSHRECTCLLHLVWPPRSKGPGPQLDEFRHIQKLLFGVYFSCDERFWRQIVSVKGYQRYLRCYYWKRVPRFGTLKKTSLTESQTRLVTARTGHGVLSMRAWTGMTEACDWCQLSSPVVGYQLQTRIR